MVASYRLQGNHRMLAEGQILSPLRDQFSGLVGSVQDFGGGWLVTFTAPVTVEFVFGVDEAWGGAFGWCRA